MDMSINVKGFSDGTNTSADVFVPKIDFPFILLSIQPYPSTAMAMF